MERCDDCRLDYKAPAYYTFPEEACTWTTDNGKTLIAHECTGNICPDCAGPDLEPDDPDDRRRRT